MTRTGVSLSLDEESLKIWKSLPEKGRSQLVKDFLHRLKNKPLEKTKNPDIAKFFCETSKRKPGSQKKSEEQETRLYQAARIVQKPKRRKLGGLEDDMKKLFGQATE